ncbi:hypothetical protein AB0K67_37105 [Nonomuraea sp. NPDC052634]|jgi:hypothetical protein|uniref:hypothetical protein n=1 Tax=unclassified Nonomuraea TaxID=2593643 RepID=UPI00344A0FF6
MRAQRTYPAAILASVLLLTACQAPQEPQVDTRALPATAAPPFVCDYIPLEAVRLMTGIQDPLVKGDFDLTAGQEVDGKTYATGGCYVYRPTGDKTKVLQISLAPADSTDEVQQEIDQGATPLPDIVPGATGYYGTVGDGNSGKAIAVLVTQRDELLVDLIHGVKGRDNAADTAALMKLIAPKLLPAATASAGESKD